VLDVVGDTGGYNLQAAFSTARLAAESISGSLPENEQFSNLRQNQPALKKSALTPGFRLIFTYIYDIRKYGTQQKE
jgi:hypothetical protein